MRALSTVPFITRQSDSKRSLRKENPNNQSVNGMSSQPMGYSEKIEEVVIAVMGATGSGKTTFINLLSGSKLRVGGGLESCTSSVQSAPTFELDGRQITLIDTPGFDDTTRSDTDILKMIAAFLATTYQDGIVLAGVIYVHRISDVRMGGVSTRNFNMFRRLCGEATLRNVVIVTNMWSQIDQEVGKAREAELASRDIFFKPVLDKLAQMVRNDNTLDSARAIIRRIVMNHPLALRIQEELVDEHKDISQTAAGEELNRELMEQVRRHQAELKKLKEEMTAAIKEQDEETRRELEEEYKKLHTEMTRVQADSQRLASDYNAEKARLEERLQRAAEQAKRDLEKQEREFQKKVQEYNDRLQEMRYASAADKADVMRQLDALKQRHSGSSGRVGIFRSIGGMLDSLFGL